MTNHTRAFSALCAVVALAALLLGALQVAAFVAVAGLLTAVLLPPDPPGPYANRRDARRRNPRP